jgi:hypothetical protein
MSTGFRIFLLTLFAFGAIYAYRFREPQLEHWLGVRPAAALPDERDGLVSPVDRVLEHDVSLARLVGEPLPRPARPRRRQADVHADPANAGSFAEGLPPEERLSAADLAESDEGSWNDSTADATTDVAKPPDDAEPPEPPDVENGGDGAGPRIALDDTRAPVGYTQLSYKVESGDNLWKIATKTLGSGARFGEIREMNPEVFRGKSTDALATGTVLKILVPAQKDSLKVPREDVDTSVEGNSASGSNEPRRGAPRQSAKQIEKTKKIAGR